MTWQSITRTVGLWVMILAAAGSAAIDFLFGNSVWGWFKVVVAAIVISFEVEEYIRKRRTISTQQKDFMLRNALAGWASLALFALALSGLIVHLSFW